MKMPHKGLASGLAILLAVGTSSCASHRIVTVNPPGVPTEVNPYAERELVLAQFSVRNTGTKDRDKDKEALREQFLTYLRILGSYRSVVYQPLGPGTTLKQEALVMKMDLYLELEEKKNYIVGFPVFAGLIFGFGLIWPFTPRKGQSTVTGNLSLFDSSERLLTTKSWRASVPFDYIIYGWYRTAPIREAFRAAYEEVFTHIVVPPKPQTPAGSELAVATVMPQTKRYRSDVDEPTYKSPQKPDDFALVVGVEKYANAPPADFAERDAESVRAHLLALGYPQRNIVFLTGQQAVKSSIEKYVEAWLPKNVREDSKVFVYFSGHGAPDIRSGQAYLVPWDGDANFLENTGYPVKRLYQKLNALAAKEVIVTLDACFSGAGGRSLLAKGTRPLVAKVEMGNMPEGKLTVFTAASSDQITSTLEEQGHGTFTYYFLKGLSGGAKDASGVVTAQGLYGYLKPKVEDAARRQNRDQNPVLQGAHRDKEMVRF